MAKMKLDMEVGLGPGRIVLVEDSAPLPKGTQPPPRIFGQYLRCGQTAAWIKMSFAREVGLGPIDIVLDGIQLPYPKRGHRTSPQKSVCVLWPNGWMDHLRCHWYEDRLWPRPRCVNIVTPPPLQKGAQPPIFGLCPLWSNGCMDQDVIC